MKREPLVFVYRNHRGEVAVRRVMPGRVWYGRTPWHPGACWLLRALDLDKDEERDFALDHILGWGEISGHAVPAPPPSRSLR